MVILIGGEKGGTGKSTIATNLAAIHSIQGEDVLLLDTDKQATATYWAITRDEKESLCRVPCLRKTGSKIHRELDDLRMKFETIIIDAGGQDSVELRSAMLGADKFYMPIRPSQFDAWTIEKIDQMVEEAKIYNEGLQAFAFLNLASPHPRVSETEGARGYIKEFKNLALSDSVIRDRIVFRKAAKEGLSVYEMDDVKAKAEIIYLHKEVFS
jgi:chromosome partitioning protein